MGVSKSPSREFIGKLAAKVNAKINFAPVVGIFSSVFCMLDAGVKADRVYTSDMSLVSAAIGYLADPSKKVADLGITVDPELACYMEGVPAGDDIEHVAGALLATKVALTTEASLHARGFLDDLYFNRIARRKQIAGKLAKMVDRLKGIHYDTKDIRLVLEEAKAEPSSFMTADVPIYDNDYDHKWATTDEKVHWQGAQQIVGYTTKESVKDFAFFTGAPQTFIIHRRRMDLTPPGWHVVFAMESKPGTAEYLACNHKLEGTYVSTSYYSGKVPEFQPLPIYDGHELTENSKIGLRRVSSDTGKHYRSLFIHKMAVTNTEDYYLLLIDGQVFASVGLGYSKLNQGTSPFVEETFGVTLSSRYKRMNKLTTLMLLAEETKRLIVSTNRSMHLREPIGIKTTVMTYKPNAAVDRGVMKTVGEHYAKEFHKNRFINVMEFTKKSWDETYRDWFKKYGKVMR